MTGALGEHAGTVLGAYGVTLALLGLLVAASWLRAVRVRQALARAEARRKGEAHGGT